MNRFERHAFVALRIVAGLLFAVHGAQKLFGVWGGSVMHFPSQLWWAAAIELVCGLVITSGFFPRPAAFLASGEMAVAYFQGHFKGDFAQWHWLPAVNHGELAVVYCFLFLYIALKPSRS